MTTQNNEELKRIAEKVINKAGLSGEEKFGSVIAILMVISIILTVIRILQECNKNKAAALSSATEKYALYGEEIRNFSSRQGWFTKMRIKKVLRKELSPEDYRKYSMQLLSAILNIGENVTDDEVITLVEAANV